MESFDFIKQNENEISETLKRPTQTPKRTLYIQKQSAFINSSDKKIL
jgi:hypothetical protein